MARAGMSAQDIFDFYRKYPDRVIPFIPFQVKGWITQDPSFVVDAERSLKRGTFRGMGEVILRHYAVPEQGASEFDIKADGGMMLKIMELGAKYKLPILIHHEAEPETVSALEKMLIHAPANVVWGHAGRATADIVEYLLNKYPNLYCDTSALDRTRSYGVEKNPITDESNQLKEEWKSLFIRFPDRFMFGVDGVFPPHYNQFVYAKATMAQRAILAQLGPEVSKRIAYDNARRLLSV
jgi:predicted TIM-barrel fold metal-dependent hydrolase